MEERLSTPSKARSEDQNLNTLIHYREAAMNSIVTSSVGMTLLQLSEKYFKYLLKGSITLPSTFDKVSHLIKLLPITNEDTELCYHSFIKELNEKLDDIIPHYLNKKTSEIAQETFDETKKELEETINYIDKIVSEAPSELDLFRVFLPVERTKSGFKPYLYVTPLKQVLILVWKALNDDEEFCHNYPLKTKPEKLLAANKDRIARIANFVKCWNQFKANPVCHHGIRNDLILATLNKGYRDIDIIESGPVAVYSYLKENIFSAFDSTYKKAETDKKRKLMQGLLLWVSQNNPQLLIDEINPKLRVDLTENLINFFLTHGVNPRDPENTKDAEILDCITNSFNCLDFSCDVQAYPILAAINEIFRDVPIKETSLDQALGKVQNYILKNENDYLVNTELTQQIINFNRVYQVYKKFKKYELIIKLNGALVDELIEFDKKCHTYFIAIIQGDALINIDDNLLGELARLDQMILDIKADKFIHPIENFFSQWHAADSDLNPVVTHTLYLMFLNQDIQSKIILKDSDIQEVMRKRPDSLVEVNEIEITPYIVNRLFLHAILIKPEQWSDTFYQGFSSILEFVNKNFNEDSFSSTSLKKDSYPEALLEQLNYLKNCYEVEKDPEIAKVERPCMVIQLPEHIQTADEWVKMADIFQYAKDEAGLETVYAYARGKIEHILFQEFITVNYRLTLRFLLQSIPGNYFSKFLDRIINSTKNINELIIFWHKFQSSTIDNCLFYITKLGNKLKNIAVDYTSLQTLLVEFNLYYRSKGTYENSQKFHDCRHNFVDNLKDQFKDIITDSKQLLGILGEISPDNRIMILYSLGEKLTSIIKPGYLVEILEKFTQEKDLIFIMDTLGDKVKDLIAYPETLTQVIKLFKGGENQLTIFQNLDDQLRTILLDDNFQDFGRDTFDVDHLIRILQQIDGEQNRFLIIQSIIDQFKDDYLPFPSLTKVLNLLVDAKNRFVILQSLGDRLKSLILSDIEGFGRFLEDISDPVQPVDLTTIKNVVDEIVGNILGDVNLLRRSLRSALANRNLQWAKLIINQCDRNILRKIDDKKQPILIYALETYYVSKVKCKDYEEVIKLLVEKGANISPKLDNKNDLPINIAQRNYDWTMANYFLDHGSVIKSDSVEKGQLYSSVFANAIFSQRSEMILRCIKEGVHMGPPMKSNDLVYQVTYNQVKYFVTSIEEAKRLFSLGKSKFEMHLNNAYSKDLNSLDKKYFKEIVVHWAKSLTPVQREKLANSATIKKAFGLDILSALNLPTQQDEHTKVANDLSAHLQTLDCYKNTLRESKKVFAESQNENLNDKYRFISFLKYRHLNKSLVLQYKELIDLNKQNLDNLSILTQGLNETSNIGALSKAELWALQEFNKDSYKLFKNTELQWGEGKDHRCINYQELVNPLKRNFTFFQDYLMDNLSGKNKHSKDRIAYCVKFIRDMDAKYNSDKKHIVNLPQTIALLKALYELKGLLLADTQFQQSRSYFGMLFNCAMTSRLAKHVEKEILSIEKLLNEQCLTNPKDFADYRLDNEIHAYKKKLEDLDKAYGNAWNRFKTALSHFVGSKLELDRTFDHELDEARIAFKLPSLTSS